MDVVELLVAWYLAVMVPTQDWPVVIGPFETQDACWVVRGLLAEQNYETDDCSMMVVVEDAQPWQYPYGPRY